MAKKVRLRAYYVVAAAAFVPAAFDPSSLATERAVGAQSNFLVIEEYVRRADGWQRNDGTPVELEAVVMNPLLDSLRRVYK